MSLFTDDPALLQPAFEPRFALRRLIGDRGGIYDRRVTDGRLNDPPAALLLDSVHATLLALDPLVLALAFAGYDAREIVIGTSAGGQAFYRQQGFFSVSMRSGLGHAEIADWAVARHITDPGTFHNVVALRVLAWRQATDPPVRVVDLTGVDGYQPYRDPADDWSDAHDGWLLLGSATASPTSQTAGAAVKEVLPQVVDALVDALTGDPAAGLVHVLDPVTWSIPRERDAPLPTLIDLAERIWNVRASSPSRVREMLGLTALDVPAIDEIHYQTQTLMLAAGVEWRETTAALTEELEQRRRVLQPIEWELSSVIARIPTQHWALAVIQLHEYGLIDTLPLPPPDPDTPARDPAIPVVDLTGFYIAKTDATGDGAVSMQLNQAGPELRGWWTDTELQVWPLTGTYNVDAEAEGRFEFDVVSTADGVPGSLYLAAPPTADVRGFGVYAHWDNQRSAIYGMVRASRKGRVPPGDVVTRLGQTDRAGQVEPLLLTLHPVIAGRIQLLADLLFDQIRVVSSVIFEGGDLATEAMNATVINLGVNKDLLRRDGPDFALTPLLERMQVMIRNFLSRQPVPEAANVDAWFQLRSIVAMFPAEAADLAAALGIVPDVHNYEFQMFGRGGDIGVDLGLGASGGGFKITCQVWHKQTCSGPDIDHGWDDRYHGGMLVGGGGIAAGGGAEAILCFADLNTNALDTPGEWLRDDFLCMFVCGDASGAAETPALGPALATGVKQEGYTFFRGRDGAMVSGSGNGGFVTYGLGAKTGGWNGSVGGQWGLLVYREGDPPPDGEVPPVQQFDLRGADASVQYFEIGEARLTPQGEAVLQELALTYRPLLDDTGSYLIIEGDASRTGDTDDNLVLSRNRALAVHDYLRALLSAPPLGAAFRPACSLAITDSHIIVSARGESRPAYAQLPDGVENAEWRRTTLTLFGRYTAGFQAAGVFVSPEPAEPQ